ncbi:LuxR C-terminal-related transcriptional regulator [Streptomyces sp. NBC_01808]|nr:LuxR C-terminal-related transcriptional regulator [Streptomyces sp. NBC_01808]WSA42151.1 LuxR C-terminal-related transcriptional regulator [Streptomyces sp. NBC_01808]
MLAGFRARLDGLPERARLMAVLAAAEARGDLPLLRAAEALGTGLDELDRSGLLHTTGTAVAFRHPLIATAAYRGAPLAARIAAHRALAGATGDPDCRAHHLAVATTAPDAGAAAEIAAAAERARRRTAYAARARPADRLTPQELQVARLAAQGLSSRQIGARLFLSPRTVEHHLYQAYPKLGVASRAELARVELAGPGDG